MTTPRRRSRRRRRARIRERQRRRRRSTQRRIPAKPTGQARTDLLAALRKISPALVADEDDAIDNSRNQCSAINGKAAKLDWSAQQRFGTSSHEVSDAEAKQINAALTTFCKTA